MLCKNTITRIVDALCNTGWTPTSKTSVQRLKQFEMTFNDVGPERLIVLQRAMGNEMPDFALQIDQARNGFLVHENPMTLLIEACRQQDEESAGLKRTSEERVDELI